MTNSIMFFIDDPGLAELIEQDYKILQIKIPFKWIEKGFLVDIDDDYEEFINHIKDRINMGDISEKTKLRYLKNINNNESELTAYFLTVKNFFINQLRHTHKYMLRYS